MAKVSASDIMPMLMIMILAEGLSTETGHFLLGRDMPSRKSANASSISGALPPWKSITTYTSPDPRREPFRSNHWSRPEPDYAGVSGSTILYLLLREF